ncbi:MAG TPA: choice-of-anchor tandem repeat GloVer-containing protein [Candidatus Baltobacteraceae bacterium]|nr:choice-of-anchor tandem repeat GloVer-containing protein [Candidatus Baltobacteraceae bacterium]
MDTNQNAVLIGGYLYNDDDGTAFYGSCVVDAGGNGYSDIANVTTSFTISAAGSVSLTASADDSSFSYQMQGFKVLSGPFLSTAGLYTLDLGAGQTLTAIVAANGWIYRDSPSYGGGGRVQVTGYGQSATESSLGHSVNTFILNQNATVTLNGSSTMNRADSVPTPPILQATAVLTTLHSFQGFSNGAEPVAGLVQGSDGYFYGTTEYGGMNGYGTVFKISATGAFTRLHSFDGNDGASPKAALVEGGDGNFYGTTWGGGTNGGWGTVFKISASGAFSSLYSFTGGSDGSEPTAGLAQGSDGNFYGTTEGGGRYDGTVFKISASGAFTSLYSFAGLQPFNGDDGEYPEAALVLGSDGDFYGTTSAGGTNASSGTVFKISAGGVLTSIHSFAGTDGVGPEAGLVQGSDGNFYGTTPYGGTNLYIDGTVFKISASGAFTSLHSFDGKDGTTPETALVQGSDGNFYGTTAGGGTNADWGTVFKVSASGAFTSLYSFSGGNDGGGPNGLVQGSDGNFYGTTTTGGPSAYGGTVFKISASGAFTSLYSFIGGNDGAYPEAALAQGGDGNFYGTTAGGGTNGNNGTVFTISASGAFTGLHSFDGNDGATIASSLVQGSDGNFYGTTAYGGTDSGFGNDSVFTTDSGFGTVFMVSTGGVLTSLHSFAGKDGASPRAALVEGGDGNFYGTTWSGGTNFGSGTVFRINASGAFASLYSFTGGNDGGGPGGLVPDMDGNFYGTTAYGGTNGGNGTVFKISASGALTSLYSFTGGYDGGGPGGLVLARDGNFYGTTSTGGMSGGYGTVFKISASGAIASLYSFTGGNDGANPASLVQGSDGNFYGTATYGGSNSDLGTDSGFGTVFMVSASGVFASLHAFAGNDGGAPNGLVQGSDGNFYGTTDYSGPSGYGTVFRLNVVFNGQTNFTVSVSAAPASGGTVSGGGTYPSGSVNTVTASANSGYAFVDWTENGTVVSSLANYTFILNSNDALVANFTTVPTNGWVGTDDFFSGISAKWTVYQQNYGQMLAVGTNQHLSFIVGASTSAEQNAEVVWNGTPAVSNDWTMDITGHNSASWSANGDSQLQLWVVNSANTATGYRIAMAGGSDQASEYVFNTKTPSSGSRQNVPATNADFGLRLVHRGGVLGDIEAWYDPTGNGVAWTLLDTISMAAFWPGVVAGDTFTVAIVADTYYGPIAEGQLWADNFRITNSAIAPSAPVALEIATTNAAFGFTNGVFGFSISGPAGSNVVIEVSADLKTWIPLQTNHLGGGPLYFSDSQSPTNRQRFYRAELLP